MLLSRVARQLFHNLRMLYRVWNYTSRNPSNGSWHFRSRKYILKYLYILFLNFHFCSAASYIMLRGFLFNLLGYTCATVKPKWKCEARGGIFWASVLQTVWPEAFENCGRQQSVWPNTLHPYGTILSPLVVALDALSTFFIYIYIY